MTSRAADVSDPHHVRTFAWIIGSRAELVRQAIMGFEKGANTLEKTKRVLHLTLALLGIGCNGTENSLRDSGDLLCGIRRAPKRS
jgi:hypothetical protein